MMHTLLDSFETENREIAFSFYKEAMREDVYVWLQVGQAGLKIPATLVDEFLEVADAIKAYLDDREKGNDE